VTDPRLDLSVTDGIARLTIRRADKRNALDADMVDALQMLCRQIERSDAYAVILSGDGTKSFSAGGDIDAWSRLSPESFGRHWVRDGHVALDALARLLQPVIAVIDGDCLGGGLELAACADLRIAEVQVKIGQPEPGLGIIPGWSGTQRVVRRFGAQAVRRMALMGEVFSAQEAMALGVVDQVVPTGQGFDAAFTVAERLRTRAPRATELTKMMVNAAEGEEHERVMESLAGSLAAGSPDLAEGLAAFREKRAPVFLPRT
jgi:enoyl-CoA hydratase/carnithine racemase